MQVVTQAWEDTNRSAFTRPANVVLSFALNDGRHPIYDNTRIITFTSNKSGDPLSAILTQDTITFTLDNADGRLSYDPEVSDIYKNASVSGQFGFMTPTYDSYDGINVGKYYISDVDMNSSQRKITFTAKSILAFMTSKIDDDDGFSDEDITALSAANKIIQVANADDNVPESNIQTVFDTDTLSSCTVNIQPGDCTLAEALQLIANACCCILFVDRSGKIHIEKRGDVSENYVISNKICYDFPKLKYGSRVNRVKIYYEHGVAYGTTKNPDVIGGVQNVTNPILSDDFGAQKVMRETLAYYQNRCNITGTFRADPRIDIFDIIVIPHGKKVSVCCLTSINMTFNGGWRGTFEAVEIEDAILDLRIIDIEQLTIEQFESLTIEQLHPNTVSDIDGDYLACDDGTLVLWKGE